MKEARYTGGRFPWPTEDMATPNAFPAYSLCKGGVDCMLDKAEAADSPWKIVPDEREDIEDAVGYIGSACSNMRTKILSHVEKIDWFPLSVLMMTLGDLSHAAVLQDWDDFQSTIMKLVDELTCVKSDRLNGVQKKQATRLGQLLTSSVGGVDTSATGSMKALRLLGRWLTLWNYFVTTSPCFLSHKNVSYYKRKHDSKEGSPKMTEEIMRAVAAAMTNLKPPPKKRCYGKKGAQYIDD